MQIITREEIVPLVSIPMAISVVKDAFMAFSEGLIDQPEPMQMLFKEDDGQLFGDCHVKAAQQKDHPYFVIKVAAGFYRNTAIGLPANNGLLLVMSSETGHPVALLKDEGWLTQIRTAAAGALAAALKPVAPDACLGIIGTGSQAYWQAALITQHLGLTKVAVFGRDHSASVALCDTLHQEFGLTATPMSSAYEVCQASNILVTVTPSSEPLIKPEDLPDEIHIVAVGADSPGKNEIASEIFKNADIMVTDNHEQCLAHGDFGVAVRAGMVAKDADISLPDVLAGKHSEMDFSTAKWTLVDLTGMGAQDLAIASLVVDNLTL
ncbi:ornithine cyclodeaminase family protein [Marinomonas pollencensis]|uniref:Ornithine cyclodeaminase n=1 Tax=Marinomonas pollencensis TaxID=491954 RepID=A0A3E0DVF7_9GAMM|nr:ornithine cyclodeaminase family protein [Marinomonas pollencensis]REG85629.1 ornithine cyclodeaminase [Marinomonas pollencensis]